MATPSSSTTTSAIPEPSRATSILVIGMAGSGKSSFAAKLAEHSRKLAQDHKGKGNENENQNGPQPAYCVNLDPAVATLGYEPNVDIRDTIDYARVMEE